MPSRTATEISPAAWNQFRPFSVVAQDTFAGEFSAEARSVAAGIACALKEHFGAKRVVLFGSFARNDFDARSDLDLAVWGINPAEYYRAVAFATGCTKGFKVDLVDPTDCSESLLQHILRDGVEL
jgi:uncharacterized protein